MLSKKFLKRSYNVWFNLQNILKMTELEMENKLVVVSIWEGWRERDENDYEGLAWGRTLGDGTACRVICSEYRNQHVIKITEQHAHVVTM